MAHLTPADLMSLEQYSRERPAIRARVIEHKKCRQVPLGPNATLYFEDEQTIRYQIQEMLRIEKTFEQAGIQDELDAYNPLIPDGSNWKATFMIEYPDVAERRRMLTRLIGIERAVWVRVAGFDRIAPVANEDLERETEEKTSAIHFLRFELTPDMVRALKGGAPVAMGVGHASYTYEVAAIPEDVRKSLAADLA